MNKVRIPNLARLRELVGSEVAVSDWHLLSQERIALFSQATGDDQWIHVDEERARRESPYGISVAHGFLTLSLLPFLLKETLEFEGVRMGINYGLDRVRFTGPVPAGSRVRARFHLDSVRELAGGVQVKWTVTVEREGAPKPVMIAEWITRRFE
jgi:acyl dehydratase